MQQLRRGRRAQLDRHVRAVRAEKVGRLEERVPPPVGALGAPLIGGRPRRRAFSFPSPRLVLVVRVPVGIPVGLGVAGSPGPGPEGVFSPARSHSASRLAQLCQIGVVARGGANERLEPRPVRAVAARVDARGVPRLAVRDDPRAAALRVTCSRLSTTAAPAGTPREAWRKSRWKFPAFYSKK